MTNLNFFQINTTAWEEEDFLLLTSLTEEQVTDVIEPIIEEYRSLQLSNEVQYYEELEDHDEKLEDYDNDFLIMELKKLYPDATILHYTPSEIDLISI